MSRKHSTGAARKQTRPAARWGRYLLAGALLAVLVAASTAGQPLVASGSPDMTASAATASPVDNAVASSAGVGSAQTMNVYGDRLLPLVEETGEMQRLNIYGPGGQIIAQAARDGSGGQEVRHLLPDHLGSTRAAVDADGSVVARFEYAPHGETTVAGTAGSDVEYRYTGHPYDEGQQVYETPARVYDPTLGRFLSVDPQRQDANPYVYAGNNPVGYLDLTGGTRRPFIVKSGFNVATGNDRVVKTLAISLGAAGNQNIMDATGVFGQPGPETRSRQFWPNRVLYQPDGKGGKELKYNDKLYWLIGDELPVQVPGDIEYRLNKLRGEQPDFALGIVLVDVSSTRNKWKSIGAALKDINVPHSVVFGKVKKEWGLASDTASQKTTNATGMYAYQMESNRPEYTEFNLRQYRAYVDGVAEYMAGLSSSDRVRTPTSESVSTSQSSSEFPWIQPVMQNLSEPSSQVATGRPVMLPQWASPLED